MSLNLVNTWITFKKCCQEAVKKPAAKKPETEKKLAANLRKKAQGQETYKESKESSKEVNL